MMTLRSEWKAWCLRWRFFYLLEAGFGFFDVQLSPEPKVSLGFHRPKCSFPRLQRQSGVLRTNCFDTLDRTNLLQYQAHLFWGRFRLLFKPAGVQEMARVLPGELYGPQLRRATLSWRSSCEDMLLAWRFSWVAIHKAHKACSGAELFTISFK